MNFFDKSIVFLDLSVFNDVCNELNEKKGTK